MDNEQRWRVNMNESGLSQTRQMTKVQTDHKQKGHIALYCV